jgi:hypothetical protein
LKNGSSCIAFTGQSEHGGKKMPGMSRKKDLAAERKNLETSSGAYWLAGWAFSAAGAAVQIDGGNRPVVQTEPENTQNAEN